MTLVLERVWMTDFRSYITAEFGLAPGLSVVTGPNGAGKSNLLEALHYLATLGSFRGVPIDTLVRDGSQQAVVRAEGRRDGRGLLVEAEINRVGRNRYLANKQPIRRVRDLVDVVQASVFSPDDLVLVKGGPGERRTYLDDTAGRLHIRNQALLDDTDKVLRQRAALLKQAGGRMSSDIELTLDVWDAKLADLGTRLGAVRTQVLGKLTPAIRDCYRAVADVAATVDAELVAPWMHQGDGLAGALGEARTDDVRRGVSTVGPHRDDILLLIDGRPSRTHSSQGEQRTLALALRLAAHRLIAETRGEAPLLLLDDLFSELDPRRSAAVLRTLPVGQAVLATAGAVPASATVEARLEVAPADGSRGSRVRTVLPSVGSATAGDEPVERVENIASDSTT